MPIFNWINLSHSHKITHKNAIWGLLSGFPSYMDKLTVISYFAWLHGPTRRTHGQDKRVITGTQGLPGELYWQKGTCRGQVWMCDILWACVSVWGLVLDAFKPSSLLNYFQGVFTFYIGIFKQKLTAALHLAVK